jgi:hypothetical protein
VFKKKLRPQTEAEANAASILAIPLEQLSDLGARDELVRRARAGQDVYAYQPMGDPLWVVWVRGRDAWEEARFRPMIWAWS